MWFGLADRNDRVSVPSLASRGLWDPSCFLPPYRYQNKPGLAHWRMRDVKKNPVTSVAPDKTSLDQLEATQPPDMWVIPARTAEVAGRRPADPRRVSNMHLLPHTTEVSRSLVMHHAAWLRQQITGIVQRKGLGIWSQLHWYSNPSSTVSHPCGPKHVTPRLLALASLLNGDDLGAPSSGLTGHRWKLLKQRLAHGRWSVNVASFAWNWIHRTCI